jgi:hypothetical protein
MMRPTMPPVKRYLSGVIASLFAAASVYADPVWHCSRNSNESNAAIATPAVENQFSIASFNSSAEVIGVSVRDLIDVYTGTAVRIGGLPLSACFLVGNDALTVSALTSLGLNLKTIGSLARKSSIVQSNLYHVNDETQMGACIAKNFPAVGYLNKPIETDNYLPCF